jgi:hypothetical protein
LVPPRPDSASGPAPADAQLRWYRLDPIDTAVDNTQPKFHFVELRYDVVELAECRGNASCSGEVALRTLKNSPVEGTGTVAIQVEATLKDGTVIQTPGAETRVFGGLGPGVHRITVRADDANAKTEPDEHDRCPERDSHGGSVRGVSAHSSFPGYFLAG